MNVFCCLCEDRHLLLGIPPELGWSIKGIPCEEGTVLTMHINGAKDIQLLGGNPVNLREQVLEIKDFKSAYTDIVGPTEYLDISHLADDITYLEVGRFCKDANSISGKPAECNDVTAHSVLKREWHEDGNAFYKWSKILRYLDDHLGKVAVEAWFDQATIVEFTDQSLKIDAGNAFRCAIIKRRCLKLIQDALMELGSKAIVEVFSYEE